jgi:dolichyl-diphosphooligosaccharide--protein glycosyltransferase
MKLEISGGRIKWQALNSYGIFLFLVPIGVIIPFIKNLGEEESNRAILSLLIFVTFLLFLAMDPYPALICYVILWFCLIGLWYLTPDDDRPATEIMLIIIFVLLAAYFFKYMVRLNILFSAFVAIQSGICFAYGLELTSSIRSSVHEEAVSKSRRRRDKRRRKKQRPVEAKPEPSSRQLDTPQIALMVVLVLFLVWTTSTSYNSARGYPLGLRDDWFDSLAWIEENSNPDDVIMSWWDYGYWIQTYAERPTIADGATTNWTQISKLAKALVTTEATGIEFCREYNVRYIMVDVSDDFIGGKWTAMAHIAKQNVGDYMGIQEGQTVIYDKGQQALLFKLSSMVAMPDQPFPLDEHFVYREQFRGERGGVVVVYEFVPNP